MKNGKRNVSLGRFTIGHGNLRTPSSNNVATALDLNLCLEVSAYFRLSNDQAIAISNQAKKAAGNYNQQATSLGINKADMQLVSGAFENYKNS